MKPTRLLLLASVALLLNGCNVGPDYHPPTTQNVPKQWSEPLAGGETAQPDPAAAWWKNFHDPELDSLINRAIAANLDLQMAEDRVRQARAQYGIANSDFLPTLDGSASFSQQQQSQNQPVLGSFSVPSSAFNNNVYQAGFDASWEIDVFGGTRRNVEAVRADVAAAEFSRRDVLVIVLGEVARDYVQTRIDQRRLAIAEANIQAQQDGLNLTQERYDKGLTSALDVEQAATLLATTQAEVPTLQSSIKVSIHRLGVLLAQPPGALQQELSATAPIPAAPPQVPVGLPSDLLRRRPDVQQAERELAAQTARIGVATADLFPKFYLTGTAGFESVSASDWFAGASKFWSIGPTLQWKLFEGDKIRSNIKVQTALQQQALANYEKTVLISLSDVDDSLTEYANEQMRRQSLERAVASSQDSLNLANERYKDGIASFLDVLEAERSLLLTQDQLALSDGLVTVDVISLYKALGGGWETVDLKTPPAPTAPAPTVAQM
ncbi:MAG: efflux transporter outer membrane subunit [Opitutales bacterium]|jgi:NodT family efflux transporter outer membrane factor (OMF) lipoprotein